MSNIYGVHDREGRNLVPMDGWCVDTVALSENPSPVDYRTLRSDINWVVRLNWGYGTTGTYPKPEQMNLYVDAANRYAQASKNVRYFILGNEPNHEQERPDGVFLSPEYVATIFAKTRQTIRSSNPSILLATPAFAPYHANGSQSWIEYAQRTFQLIESTGADALALHAYTRSDDPEDIHSEELMSVAPLAGTYSGFATYHDFLIECVPSSMSMLPAFITEFARIGRSDGWLNENTGIIKEAYEEVNDWNKRMVINIRNLIFFMAIYRFPNYDSYGIESKNEVMQDFTESTFEDYQIPEFGATSPSKSLETHLPTIEATKPPSSPSAPFKRYLDERAIERGVNIVAMDEPGWKVKKVIWYDEKQSEGRHHLYINLLDEAGRRVFGKKVKVIWPTGSSIVTTEDKGASHSIEFPLSPSRNEFSVIVEGDGLSEMVRGIGMGADTPSGFNPGIHTSTLVEFQKVNVASAPIDDPEEDPKTVLGLVHPVRDPKYRILTQGFGGNEEYYKRFKVDGVPLKGHNGLDFGTPVGSYIQAVDNGKILEVGDDPEGYGLYIKLGHVWGESLYAHLSDRFETVGAIADKGSIIGRSGNTGRITGPHLHFGMRIFPYRRNDGWGGYIDPSKYLVGTIEPEEEDDPSPSGLFHVFKIAASKYGLEWQLLASLAWAESSFNVKEENGGLFQIGEAAWSDFSGGIDYSHVFDPLDNAHVAAAYLNWLLAHYKDSLNMALAAYNFGVGNVDAGKKIPRLTNEYVNKVIHGRDLLKGLGLTT